MFGNWIQTLHSSDVTSYPFPHVVIDNFFTEDAYARVSEEFGPVDATWDTYWNPIEKKHATKVFDSKPFIHHVFNELQSQQIVSLFSSVTKIPDLEPDTMLHGAGLHYHPRGGKLDMHLDYSIHPYSKKERRLNLIIYMNDEWDETWGGALEFWDSDFTECKQRIYPIRNRAVLFQTSDISYHGIPHPIQCPETTGRRSLAMYYVSEPRLNVIHRLKAEFRPLPGQEVSPQHAMLYNIRKTRLIQKEDLWDGWDA